MERNYIRACEIPQFVHVQAGRQASKQAWHVFTGSWEKIVADFQDKHMFTSSLVAYRRGMFQCEIAF